MNKGSLDSRYNHHEVLMDRVLVKVKAVPEEELTPGGIVIALSKKKVRQQALCRGTLVAIGPTAYDAFGTRGQVKVGDEVEFLEYGGRCAFDEGEDPEKDLPTLRFMNDEDIYSKIHK